MQRPGCQPTWPSWRRDVWPSPYRRASGPALAASAHAGTRVGEPSGDRSTARRTGPPPGRPVDRYRPTGRPVPATGRRGTGSRSNSTGDPVDRYWPTGRHCTGDGRQCRSTGRPVPVDRSTGTRQPVGRYRSTGRPGGGPVSRYRRPVDRYPAAGRTGRRYRQPLDNTRPSPGCRWAATWPPPWPVKARPNCSEMGHAHHSTPTPSLIR